MEKFLLHAYYIMKYIKAQSWDLFFSLLYINDLPNASHFEATLFADDTNLYVSHNNINSLHSHIQ